MQPDKGVCYISKGYATFITDIAIDLNVEFLSLHELYFVSI